ncbi:MAG: Stp1/IreP family PP2C-type Ser/Thr phosphatase [Thermodesulfobacteriota bacterium]|nr:Stp1/IreP family PP2C-type Ser/Thr phosphatase [Thermodesulfobacteriota bacterium]
MVYDLVPHTDSFGKTDHGLKRPNNEDAFIVQPDLGFCAVADGMGGAAAGELASAIFIETTLEVFSKSHERSERGVLELVQMAFRYANERILSHVKENPQHQGMGCTAELLAYCKESFVIGHIGDSRIYRVREGHLKQVTEDHSLVQDQLNKGLITPEEAKNHKMRNVILRAVGINENMAVDFIRGQTSQYDLFLLCSDGLTDMVDDVTIQKTLSSPSSLSHKVADLIELAKSNGGYDNITVVLSEIL